MKTAEEWGQVYWDELRRVLYLKNDDLHEGQMAFEKVIEGVRREAAEEMRELCAEIVEMDSRTPGKYTFPLADRIRKHAPLPGEAS